MRKTAAVVRKEFRLVLRDKFYLGQAIIMPVAMLFLLGYGMKLDVERVPIVVYDLDGTPQSRLYIESFAASPYFVLSGYLSSYSEVERALKLGRAMAGIIIPPGFGRELDAGRRAETQILIDGSFPNTGQLVRNYVSAVNAMFNARLVAERVGPDGQPALRLEPRVWFNPELKSVNFIIPGLIVVIMTFIPARLSALSIVREKEIGSIENVIAAPVSPFEFIIGKMAPYAFIALLDLALVWAFGRLWFDVPFKGSFLLFLASSVIYVSGMVAVGLLVSMVVRTQVAALMLSAVATLIPAFLYSGFLFSIETMGRPSQLISYLFPTRHFMEIVRGIYLKGSSLAALWPELLFMTIHTVVILGLSLWLFGRIRR